MKCDQPPSEGGGGFTHEGFIAEPPPLRSVVNCHRRMRAHSTKCDQNERVGVKKCDQPPSQNDRAGLSIVIAGRGGIKTCTVQTATRSQLCPASVYI